MDDPRAPHQPSSGAVRVLLFTVGTGVYGCEIDVVREIIPYRRPTRLPGAPAFVAGLINLRGSIVMVLDLARRLGASDRERQDGSVVLVEQGNKLVGLAVDAVRDVQPLSREQIEAGSPAASRELQGIVKGLGHLDDEVVILLDVQTLVRQVLL